MSIERTVIPLKSPDYYRAKLAELRARHERKTATEIDVSVFAQNEAELKGLTKASRRPYNNL